MSNDIIITNEYYKELREEDIRNHYLTYKSNILKETNNKQIVLFLATAINTYIVKRNINYNPIILTEANYEYIMHGRVLSIAMEAGPITNMWFVDIDPGKLVKKDRLWKVLELVITVFENKYQTGESIWKHPRVFNTASGFHVDMRMKTRNTPVKIKENIIDYLERNINYDDVLIHKRRTNQHQIILDLSSLNSSRSARVVPYALNRNGLMCRNISRTWRRFKFADAKIK